MDKYDYDFSVLITKCGCYTDRNKALAKAHEEYTAMCAEYDKEMREYFDEDGGYDIDDGNTYVEADDKDGYYRIAFGHEEHYESHSVYVEEWELAE